MEQKKKSSHGHPWVIYIEALFLTYRNTELKDIFLTPIACWDFLIQKLDFKFLFSSIQLTIGTFLLSLPTLLGTLTLLFSYSLSLYCSFWGSKCKGNKNPVSFQRSTQQ